MLRNFGMRKIRLLRPTRSDQYSAGPLDVSFTARAITSISKATSGNATSARVRSKKRFTTSPVLLLRCSCAGLLLMLNFNGEKAIFSNYPGNRTLKFPRVITNSVASERVREVVLVCAQLATQQTCFNWAGYPENAGPFASVHHPHSRAVSSP